MKKVKLPIVGAVSVTTLVLGAAVLWWFRDRLPAFRVPGTNRFFVPAIGKSFRINYVPTPTPTPTPTPAAKFQAQGMLTKQSSPVTSPPRAVDVEEDSDASVITFGF